MKIHHAAITVRDMEESIAWYARIFGFVAAHRRSTPAFDMTLLELGEARLELFCPKEDAKDLPAHSRNIGSDLEVMGVKHFALEVDDLDTTIADLSVKDVEFVTQPDQAFFGGKYLFIKDCNGILIELFQRS